MGDAAFERLDLCVDANLCGRQSGDTHLHLDKLHPTRLLGLGSHLLHLADSGLGEVVDAQFCHQPID